MIHKYKLMGKTIYIFIYLNILVFQELDETVTVSEPYNNNHFMNLFCSQFHY